MQNVLINNGKTNQDIADRHFTKEKRLEDKLKGKFGRVYSEGDRIELCGDTTLLAWNRGIVQIEQKYFKLFADDGSVKKIPRNEKEFSLYWNGVITQKRKSEGKFEFSARPFGGRKKRICERNFDNVEWFPYGKGIIVREEKSAVLNQPSGPIRIHTFISYNEKGIETELFKGVPDDWKAFDDGVIVNTGDALEFCKDTGYTEEIFGDKMRSFDGYGMGAILANHKGKQLELSARNLAGGKPAILYRGPNTSWRGYGNGVLVAEGNKIVAYREKNPKYK